MKYLIILIFPILCIAQAQKTTWETMKSEWKSPFYDDEALEVLTYGTVITAFMALHREDHFDRIQEKMAEDDPMGKYHVIGDYGGKLVPNLFYMGWWYYKGRKDRFWLMTKASFYAGMTTTVLKKTFNEPRPHKGDNNSFPSGHTTTAFAFASVVAMEHETVYGVSAYALATYVGLSRMNDNAHYLHDVVFGATLGISYGISLWNQQQKAKKVASTPFILVPFEDGAILSSVYNW